MSKSGEEQNPGDVERTRFLRRLSKRIQWSVAIEVYQFFVLSLLIVTGLMVWMLAVGWIFVRWLYG